MMADAPIDRFTGPWIAVESGVGRDSRTHQLADSLGMSIPLAVGHLVLLWGGVAEHEPRGLVGPLPDKTLEVWALWKGRRGRFASAFRKLFVDADGQIHKWDRHNGRFLAEALRERQRKADARAAQKSADGAWTVRGQSTVNPTQPNPTLKAAAGQAGLEGVAADITATIEATKALNAGMLENPAIGSRLIPVSSSGGSGVVAEWVAEGIPLDTIVNTCRRLGRDFKPKGKSTQVGSLQYCDSAVREAHVAVDDERYRFLAGEARRGMDMGDTAKYPDWEKYRARYKSNGKKVEAVRG